MKITKEYIYDIAKLNEDELVTPETLRETAYEFDAYLQREHVITDRIKALLIDRLKFATGKLYNSLELRAGTTRRVAREKSSIGGYKVIRNPVKIFLTIDSDNPDLINALLGEQELGWHKTERLPNIADLMQYIIGKRSFFDKNLDAIKRRQDAVRMLLKARREDYAASDARASGKLNVPSRKLGIKDPVRALAHIIRGRMGMRVAKGLSPTKGSEYIFLGNYPEYEDTEADPDASKSSFAPKYRKVSTPLLTIRQRNIKGEINKIMETEMKDHLDSIVSQYVRKDLERYQMQMKREQLRGVIFTNRVIGEGLKGMHEKDEREAIIRERLEDILFDKSIEILAKIKNVKLDEYEMIEIRNQKIDYHEIPVSELEEQLHEIATNDKFGLAGPLLTFLEDTIIQDLINIHEMRGRDAKTRFISGAALTQKVMESTKKVYLNTASKESDDIIKTMKALRNNITIFKEG